VVYVEKNQIQYRPHRNRSRDSLSQYTVYVASTRKSCRAGDSNAYTLITSAESDYLTVSFFASPPCLSDSKTLIQSLSRIFE